MTGSPPQDEMNNRQQEVRRIFQEARVRATRLFVAACGGLHLVLIGFLCGLSGFLHNWCSSGNGLVETILLLNDLMILRLDEGAIVRCKFSKQ